MTIIDSIILGLIQGLSEFIPISSSGHLIIARFFLDLDDASGLAFDAVLQLSTALAAIIYFRRDVYRILVSLIKWIRGIRLEIGERKTLAALLLGTIPTIFMGLVFEDYMETIFRNVAIVAVALIFGSVIMAIAEFIAKKRVYEEELSEIKGLSIGLFQCLALIPGISRSGATISGGLFAGLSRETAAKFSFLLSIPILLGSGLKKLWEILSGAGLEMGNLATTLLPASITAFVVGLLAIHFLIRFLRSNSLYIFIWYRVVVAIVLFVWFV